MQRTVVAITWALTAPVRKPCPAVEPPRFEPFRGTPHRL